MPYPYTLALHIVSFLLCLITVIYLFSRKANFNTSPLTKYFRWFVFFAIYNVLLVISALFFRGFPTWAGVGYVIALFFLGVAAWQAFLAALDLTTPSEKTRGILAKIYIVGVLLAVLLHAVFFEIPVEANANWIFWYSNRAVSLFYIFFMFVAGWTFAFVFGKNISATPNTLLKTRLFLMSLSGFILPFAAFFYFGTAEISHLSIAFLIVGVGLIFFIVVNPGIGYFGIPIAKSHSPILSLCLLLDGPLHWLL